MDNSNAPDGFLGKTVRDPAPASFRQFSGKDECVLYRAFLIPDSWEEVDEFVEYGASEYDLIVRVGKDGTIEDMVFRIDQCPHGRRSFTPRGAPAWVFGVGARFTLDWNDVAPVAQKAMLALLRELTAR